MLSNRICPDTSFDDRSDSSRTVRTVWTPAAARARARDVTSCGGYSSGSAGQPGTLNNAGVLPVDLQADRRVSACDHQGRTTPPRPPVIGFVASGTLGSATATMSFANSGTFGSTITVRARVCHTLQRCEDRPLYLRFVAFGVCFGLQRGCCLLFSCPQRRPLGSVRQRPRSVQWIWSGVSWEMSCPKLMACCPPVPYRLRVAYCWICCISRLDASPESTRKSPSDWRGGRCG